MQGICDNILSSFMLRLERSHVPARHHAEYVQWLRYYLDFSAKGSLPYSKAERVRLFCEMLKSKGSSADEQRRAAHTVSLYFAITKNEPLLAPVDAPRDMPAPPTLSGQPDLL